LMLFIRQLIGLVDYIVSKEFYKININVSY
jgi:hypothetical protein